jgi:hypothetical protein
MHHGRGDKTAGDEKDGKAKKSEWHRQSLSGRYFVG